MKTGIPKLLVATIVFFAVHATEALAAREHRYVDCSEGSNTNPGTSALPWATIEYAISSIPQAETTIHVKHNPGASCPVLNQNIGIKGPGPDCRSNPNHCLIVSGEVQGYCDPSGCTATPTPAAFRSNAGSEASDGLRIKRSHIKLQNINFVSPWPSVTPTPGLENYNTAVLIETDAEPGETPEITQDVVLENVRVLAGAATNGGVGIVQASNVRVLGGSVSSVSDGPGYNLAGNSARLANEIVIDGATASKNAGAGFNFANYTGTVTLTNVTVEGNTGAGIDVSAANNDPEIIVVGADIQNNYQGIKSTSGALHVENAFIATNKAAGIQLQGGNDTDKRVAVISSTILNNSINTGGNSDSAQIQSIRKRGSLTVVDSIVASTVATSTNRGRALRYEKRNNEAFIARWSHSLFHRESNAIPVVAWQDRNNVEHSCTEAQLGDCDAVGDCDRDGVVEGSELVTARDIAFEILSSTDTCRQADENGDKKVTVEERVGAGIAGSALPYHNGMFTGTPVFITDTTVFSGMRLASSSPGRDIGEFPSDIPDILSENISVCRADVCDLALESRSGAGVGLGYDLGAMESDGNQAACTVSPGACTTPLPGYGAIEIEVRDRSVCTTAEFFNALVKITVADGAIVSGIQADLTFDSNKLSLDACTTNLASTTDFTAEGVLLSGTTNKVRVMFGDFAADHDGRSTTGSTLDVFHCRFNVLSNPFSTSTEITIDNVVVSNAFGDRITPQGGISTVSGVFTPQTCGGSGC